MPDYGPEPKPEYDFHSCPPSSPDLLSWASQLAFLSGLRSQQPAFDEMLFSGTVASPAPHLASTSEIDTKLGPFSTVSTELARFEASSTLWSRRAAYIETSKDARQRLHTALDRELHANGKPNDETEALGDNVLAKAGLLDELTLGSELPTAEHDPVLVKLVLGRRYPDGSGKSRVVELHFGRDDAWVDLQRVFGLWEGSYALEMRMETEVREKEPCMRWMYALESPSGTTDGKRLPLHSEEDSQLMMQALRGRHRGKSALVFQESWQGCISDGQVKMETDGEKPAAEWDMSVLDADGKPVFKMPNLAAYEGKKDVDLEAMRRRLKLPLQTREEWETRKTEREARGQGPIPDKARAPETPSKNLLHTCNNSPTENDAQKMRLRSGRKLPTRPET